MKDFELDTLTICAASTLIQSRQLSPVALTRATLRRIESLNGDMRMYITVTADEALAAARRAERAVLSGRKKSPLRGIPISLKDVFDMKGVATTAGSRVYRERIAAMDSVVAGKLKRAGAVIVGKTNLHEFGVGVTSVNPHYGAVRNPWDRDRIAGGSSGGSASAVALSSCLGSVGADTGGSIRIPAAACGIVGLKPTHGLVSLAGVIPLASALDCAGPMTKTVKDAALMLEALTGRRYADALEGDESGLQGVRVGIPRTYFYERLAPEVRSAVRESLDILARGGAVLDDVDFPSAAEQHWIFTELVIPEAWVYHEPLLAAHGALYGADVRRRIEAGRAMLSTDYFRAGQLRVKMIAESRKLFDSVDVVVTPTLPILPPMIDQSETLWLSDTESHGELDSESVPAALTRFTRPFSLTGLPAISVPCGFSNGLPIGLQIVSGPFKESILLRVAQAVERGMESSRSSVKALPSKP